VATEPLNPSLTPLYQPRYAENTSGIIAAITACIVAAGGTVVSYPSNTAGVIKALLDLKTAIGGSGGGSAGTVEIEVTAGEGLALGNAVYLHTDGKVYKAANNSTRAIASVFGLVKEAKSTGETATIIIRGSLTGLSGLTASNEQFLGTAGALTTTAPSSSGSYVVAVGQAMTASSLDVHLATPVLLT
jgi:hypothetical protein